MDFLYLKGPEVETETAYSGEEPEKLNHLAAPPMNELLDLGPNTAHMDQKPENPFQPGDRAVKVICARKSAWTLIFTLNTLSV